KKTQHREEVFEVAERSKIRRDAEDEPASSRASARPETHNHASDREVEKDRTDQQQKVNPAPVGVEGERHESKKADCTAPAEPTKDLEAQQTEGQEAQIENGAAESHLPIGRRRT